MRSKLLLLTFVLLTASVFSACADHAYHSYYVVPAAPPPPRAYGFVGVAPGPGFVWVNGYWDWRGGNWFWVRGAWVRPPRPHAVWVEPSYRRYGRGYRYYGGRWR
jgi:WXXGXW repeat (2 copies)